MNRPSAWLSTKYSLAEWETAVYYVDDRVSSFLAEESQFLQHNLPKSSLLRINRSLYYGKLIEKSLISLEIAYSEFSKKDKHAVIAPLHSFVKESLNILFTDFLKFISENRTFYRGMLFPERSEIAAHIFRRHVIFPFLTDDDVYLNRETALILAVFVTVDQFIYYLYSYKSQILSILKAKTKEHISQKLESLTTFLLDQIYAAFKRRFAYFIKKLQNKEIEGGRIFGLGSGI